MKISKVKFFILSFTWGLPVTLLGLIVSLVLIVSGHKPHKNSYGWYFKFGFKNAGFSLGPTAIVGTPSQYLLIHEFGHSLQNCLYGPAMLFLTLFSIIRFWYREFLVRVCKVDRGTLPDYESNWFENQASEIGMFYH